MTPRSIRFRTALLRALIALPATATPALGQSATEPQGEPTSSGWQGWAAYTENDTYAIFRSSDRFYTNGLRFVFHRQGGRGWDAAEHWAGAVARRLGVSTSRSAGIAATSVMFGQNMFTPDSITTFVAYPDDRPFVGSAYVALGITVVPDPILDGRPGVGGGSRNHLFGAELHLGVLGPYSLGETFQKSVHLLRRSRIPKGWNNQVSSRLFANLYLTRRWQWGWGDAWGLDLNPAIDVALGTFQTYAGGEFVVRAGRELDGFPDRTINLVRGSEFPTTFGVQLATRARAFAWNALFQVEGANGAGADIDPDAVVYETQAAVFLGRSPFLITYFFDVWRSREFDSASGGDGSKAYGALLVSYNGIGGDLWSGAAGRVKDFLTNGWILEAVVGGGVSRTPPGPDRGGLAMRVSLQREISSHVAIGVESDGILREDDVPTTAGVHRDEFLTATSGVLTFAPDGRGAESPFRLKLGLGRGRFESQRVQNGVHEETDGPTGLSMGLGLVLAGRLGQAGALIVDLSGRRTQVADGAVSSVSLGFGFRVH